MGVKVDKQVRPLSEIAADIREHWATLNTTGFAALPYVEAMATLDRVTDAYFADSGEYVVRYFLSNANGWRGEHAKRVKAELKAMLS